MSKSLRSGLLRATFGLVVPVLLGASLGLGGCAPQAPQEVAAAVEDLSPVPAPEGHLADLFVPAPDATWTKARALVGGPAAFFPQSFGALAATLLKLPVTVAAEIDGAVPVIGASLKKAATPAQAAIGIHVKAGGRFVDQLTKGPDARFVGKLDEASRITVLTTKSDTPGATPPVAMGVLGNYLLIALNPADLAAVGPYVARTLASRPAPKEDVAIEVPEAALSGPVLAEAQRSWDTTRKGLDQLGAPVLLPVSSTVEMLLGVLADSKQARFTIDLGDTAVHARMTMTPKPGGGAATKALEEMAVGDVAPILDLPQSALLGVLWREPAAVRAASIPKQADALSARLGPDAKPEDKEAILAALRAEDSARGDWVALGMSLDATGPNAMVRAPLVDEGQMAKALKQLIALTKLASVKAQLKESALDVTTNKAVVENLPGEVTRVRFERVQAKDAKTAAKDPKAPLLDKTKGASPAVDGTPTSIDLLYQISSATLFGAAGYDPKEALRALVKGPGDASFGSNAAIKAATAPLGADASFALVIDPLRILAVRAGKSAPAEAAPVVVAIGKAGQPSTMWGRVDVAAIVVQELIKHRGAF
ncbi:MAG: hypothetical protein ABJE95_34480 [Byssovorax sp.]